MTTTDLFDYSGVQDHQLRQTIAVLTILAEQAKKALDEAKKEAVNRDMGKAEPETITINGQEAGTISYSKGTESSYYVADPIAFAHYLAEYGFDQMVETIDYPREEALAKSFVKARVEDQVVDLDTGEIVKERYALPAGVKERVGRGESVTFRRNKSVTEHLFEHLTPIQVVHAITPSGEEE